MGRKSKVSYEVKVTAIEAYLNGLKSIKMISYDLSVNESSVKRWVKIYKSLGPSGLVCQAKNTCYSKELKITAIEEYLQGKGSLRDISIKYGLRSESQLVTWLMKYNSHKEIKSSKSGGNQIMAKGRTTTLDERIKIVEYCIETNKNYNDTAQKFQVSYQQVRSWVLKFEELGVDGLLDRRGKQKPLEQLSEFEKLRAEMRLLQAQNKRLEMENELLKKLDEIERGRY